MQLRDKTMAVKNRVGHHYKRNTNLRHSWIHDRRLWAANKQGHLRRRSCSKEWCWAVTDLVGVMSLELRTCVGARYTMPANFEFDCLNRKHRVTRLLWIGLGNPAEYWICTEPERRVLKIREHETTMSDISRGPCINSTVQLAKSHSHGFSNLQDRRLMLQKH